MAELKPCPWCGKTDKLRFCSYLVSDDPDKWRGFIECTECGAAGPVATINYHVAVAIWNRRAEDEQAD